MTGRELRPDPDRLLEAIKKEERQRTRGRLRIYLGYAPGVGKTYEMLEAAGHLSDQGVDVVVGVAETHGRPETEKLLVPLKKVPMRTVEHRGIKLAEMDLDAILRMHPALVLVDELAHTNAPGSRHPKRWNDVDELLDAGINVYTTVNIQHFESLNDTIARITQVRVSETVPDRILEEATEVQVVDIPRHELLKRLSEGKVYVPEQARRAAQNFFREGNLIALRQITLRRVAERLDDQMRTYMESLAIPGPWPARERLLVLIDPRQEMGERLVRAGKRLADELYAEWEVVLVGMDPGPNRGPPTYRERMRSALHLAETLGGRTNPTPLPRDARAVLDYATRNNVTRVILGWRLRRLWEEVLRPDIGPSVIRNSGPIDVLVVTDEAPPPEPLLSLAPWERSRAANYVWASLLVLAATGAGWLLDQYLSLTNLAMLYLLALVVAAVYLGLFPAIFTAAASILAYNFFFVPPLYTMDVADTEHLVTFAALLLVGIVISLLVSRTRERAESAHHREAVTASLFALTRDLAVAPDETAILASFIAHVQSTFGYSAVVIMPRGDMLELALASEGAEVTVPEMAVARWSLDHGEAAGLGTDNLPGGTLRFVPMRSHSGILGVLGIRPRSGQGLPTVEDARLLESFVSLVVLALGRARLRRGTEEVYQVRSAPMAVGRRAHEGGRAAPAGPARDSAAGRTEARRRGADAPGGRKGS